MSVAPPEEDLDTTVLQHLFEDYRDGVIYIADRKKNPLSDRTQASFRIDNGTKLVVLHEVEIKASKKGEIHRIIAELSNGERYIGPSGCGCGMNHPLPVDVDDTVFVREGEFPVVPD